MGPVLKNSFRGELFSGRPDFICAICIVFCDIPTLLLCNLHKDTKIKKKVAKSVVFSRRVWYIIVTVSNGTHHGTPNIL